MDRRYSGKGLRVIGLHSPEFDREKVAANVRSESDRLGVTWPVVLDNDFRMWDALGNRYWPTIYLIDRRGRIRHVHSGETHAETGDGRELEAVLRKLIDEPSSPLR